MTEARRPRRPRVGFPRFRSTPDRYPVPKGLRIERATPPGRYRLAQVFPGLTKTPAFGKYPGDDARIRRIFARTWAQVVAGPGYMYVAPRRTPPEIRAAGFEMVNSEEDEIIIAQGHLAKSRAMDVYLDVIHEFLHVLQRQYGREIWPKRRIPYVDRPTEIEAYAFSVAEARRLGVPDAYLRRYLRISWASPAQNLRLQQHVGVAVPRKPPARGRRRRGHAARR